MKKKFLPLCIALSLAFTSQAQSPQKFNYQAIARSSSGNVLANQNVSFKITILQGSANGTSVYSETHNSTTNAYGLSTLAIGSGSVLNGSMANINWAAGPYFVSVEMDAAGGSTFVPMGTSELMSVPYAMYAANGGTPGPQGPQGPAGPQGATGQQGPAGSANINGTANNLVKFTGATTGGNSIISDNGTRVGVGTTQPRVQFDVRMNNMALGDNSGVGAPGIYFKTGLTTDSVILFANQAYAATYFNNDGTNYIGQWISLNDNDVEPWNDNQTSMGNPLYRWANIYAGNGVIQTSDARMKTNITPLNTGLSQVMQLNPVSYNWINPKDGKAREIGFIAQEVEKVVPEAVVHSHATEQQLANARANGKPIPAITDPYAMKYNELIPVLTKAIQEQQIQIEQLKKEIELLKSK